ncbi:hypothetical protein CSC94_21350 [Zhengella mangrovi]|uniref:Uncharacterized protein n=2 Tax=Zhengella mangrovi TaxID=1982044 RepID=A0A2G1QHS6_9HYPH|nr:hypothetical protein [Zhengella mangrovi]PHP65072.1 hypothetical protein CSC94_21350 [Zhengella mangrovi]
MKTLWTMVLVAGLGGMAGCTHEAYQRNEGVTSFAGDAIAANTVMQMVDPWPRGVEETDLETPAERGGENHAKPAEVTVQPTTGS